MATELAKAYVQIVPSADGISGKISEALGGEAERSGKSAGASFASAFGTGLKTAGIAVGAVATAASALTGALVKGTGDVASYGDNIDKMSQKMGLSAQAYQEWDAIMQHSGTSIDSLQAGMKTLANAVESGNGAFERLGIAQDMIAGMDNEQLFSATITALQNVDNETERTYLAGQLLGRGATELGALLNTSAEDTEAMRQRVHELGGVMSDEAVKSAAAYQDSLQDMQTAFSGLSRNMLSEFLPSLTTVMDGLTEIFSGNGEGGLAMISDGISGLVDSISAEIPQFLEVGSGIVLALTQAITDNLPTLLTADADAVLSIAGGLIEQLPAIISAGLEVIVSLANGIAESLPELIPTIVDVVLQIVETLTDPNTLGSLIDAALAIIVALAEGLIESLPSLIERLPEIIENVVTTLIQNAPKLVEAALQIIVALAEGLITSLPALLMKGPEIVMSLVNAIIENAPQMLESAVEIVTKLASGIADNFSRLKDKGREIIDEVKAGIKQKVEDAKNWGKDLIQNFISGITAKWEALKSSISNVAQTVKDYLGFSEPSKGPLSNFHTFAPDMIDLFASGIRQGIGTVERAADSLAAAAALDMGGQSYNMGINRTMWAVSRSNDFITTVQGTDTGETSSDIVDAIFSAAMQIVNAIESNDLAKGTTMSDRDIYRAWQRGNYQIGNSLVRGVV